MDELIGKYLAGEASLEERQQVEAWENRNEENRKYVNQFRFIFDKSNAIKTWQHFDQDAAWEKMKSKLHQQKHEAKVVTIPVRHYNWVWQIAASVVIAIGVGYYLLKPSTIQPIEVIAETVTKEDTLPDGSDVYLNKKTKLEYNYNGTNKTHNVKLQGEAFFTIKHEEKKRFIIEADGVFIRDIGTTFNVKAYPNSDKIEVEVKEGEVEFYTASDTGLFLKAGGRGVFDRKTKTFSIEQPDANVLSYKTKFFSFNNQDLGAVVSDLNQIYDEQIILGKNLAKCHLTVTFNDESIDEIAQVIADTYGLTLTRRGRDFVLEGASCE